MKMTDQMITLLFIACAFLAGTHGIPCSREPYGMTFPKSHSSGQYYIEIVGNPHYYLPMHKYYVKLRGITDHTRFTDFILAVENESLDREAGNLQILGDALTRFHDRCPNTITQTNSLPKTEIQVLWTAPTMPSGCVIFRAAVVVNIETWHADDGALTLRICENSQDLENLEPPILEKCCACHEAKYEVTFESLWSRNTHPKDFPANNFNTKFSDIIGATHSVNYKFWSYNGYASDGLMELAEHGNTKTLERELKNQSEHIRTIIKARGVSYPNITGKTFAVFRVDDNHHLMSLVSMIYPSPDWIVGVSSLELCQPNCSWVESKTLNLFPYDAGTDNGTTYNSENSPIYPREPIRKITSSSPENSPFYDESGAEMKPLARLILSRQRLYEKHNCEQMDFTKEMDRSEYCALGEWSEWSPCNVDCGRGTKHRQRSYKHKVLDRHEQHDVCKQSLTQRSPCTGVQTECMPERAPVEECELTPWGNWSECSVTCGNGTMTRSRRYRGRTAAKHCQQVAQSQPKLEMNMPCFRQPCNNEEPIPQECLDRAWSEWSPCSVTCGKGTKTRVKLRLMSDELDKHNRLTRNSYYDYNDEDYEDICDKYRDIVECYNDDAPSCEDSAATEDYGSKESSNNCVYSKWSRHWSQCNVSCGKGLKFKTRTIVREAMPGGKPCRKDKLTKKRECRVPCVEDVDCAVDKWSSWSPCNFSCGPEAIQQRTRNILRHPSGNGKPCPERIERKACNLSVCPDY